MRAWQASVLAVALLIGATSAARHAAARELVVAGGMPGGSYGILAAWLCRAINAGSHRHGLGCRSQWSAGSVKSAEQLAAGKVDIAIMQADIATDLKRGEGRFQRRGPFPAARLLFRAHPELLTIVARSGGTLADLAGAGMDAGPRGSGTFVMVSQLLRAEGVNDSLVARLHDLPRSAERRAFCDGKLYAIAFVAGQPNVATEEAIGLCGGRLIETATAGIATLAELGPDYRQAVLPAGLYGPDQPQIRTLAVDALVMTTASLAPDDTATIISLVVERRDELRRLHPAFRSITAETLFEPTRHISLHDGVLPRTRAAALRPPTSPPAQ